jgi:hypothetical protein
MRGMIGRLRPLVLALVLLALTLLLSLFGPAERSLGSNVRLVYLHGSWVWTSLLGLGAASLTGFVGLFFRKHRLQDWSKSLGQTGMLFWITYLPLSLWTMQANWNGLYLTEPRFKIGLDYAVIGILLQVAILILRDPRLAGALNFSFGVALIWSISNAAEVMHPTSPIFSSESISIRLFFLGLLLLNVLTAVFVNLALLKVQTKAA